jgi:hypothetical protein
VGVMQLSYLTSLLWLGIVQQQGCYGLASYNSTVGMALRHTAARFLWQPVLRHTIYYAENSFD